MATQTHTTLGEAVDQHLLQRKLLLAPSHRVGHQWIETLVRQGRSAVNLRTTTVLDLALELVAPELASEALAFASRAVGALIVDAIWKELRPDGYLGRLEPSPGLSTAAFESLLALRLADVDAHRIDNSHFESSAKAEDVKHLLNAYEAFLITHRLVDEADVLRRAIHRLSADPPALDTETLVLIPAEMRFAGLQRKFLHSLPKQSRRTIRHPANQATDDEPANDIALLAGLGSKVAGRKSFQDDSVRMFRAVGEINEVREVLRCCLAEEQPLDDVELLYTDEETYVPLIYATARQYFAEPVRPEGVPVTFAEGIPASWSRPGRALVAWLRWIQDDFPQRGLIEMLADGLLDCGDDEELSSGYLARLLRPIAIGWGAGNYLPKLDARIRDAREPPTSSEDADELARRLAAHRRNQRGLRALRKLVHQLLELSRELAAATGAAIPQTAEKFLANLAAGGSELDRAAAEALGEQLRHRQFWLERCGLELEQHDWLMKLPAQTRVLGRGPRPGHLHVAHLASGGHAGRKRTFIVGLDDRRFPGVMSQDPVLLDGERTRISAELATSATRVREKTEELAAVFARLSGRVTLSWSCRDLVDERELFPAAIVLSAHRLIHSQSDADLEALNRSVGPPVSFAPATPEKALDESQRWLWRLTDAASRGSSQRTVVEAHYPHLARGSLAMRERSTTFGSFNGHVPQAGIDLHPFSAAAPVLSASALETAGRCPLAYFFRHALSLYRPEELEFDPDRWLDAAQFGLLLHDVFRRFLSELSGRGRRPVFERDQARLAVILHQAIERWRGEIPPPNENAFRTQVWQLVRTSRIFLLEEETFCRTSQPRFFEVALGLKTAGDGSPLDDVEPSSVGLPGGLAIRARGQIDRVDESQPHRYAVWDYKISSGYGYDRTDPFRRGRRVQSILYLRMIEAALRAKLDKSATVESFGYFFPSVRAHGLRIQWPAATLRSGLDVLRRLCLSIANGAFVATDQPDDCRYCDYAGICGDVGQVTECSKRLLEQEDLVPLRYFGELRRG